MLIKSIIIENFRGYSNRQEIPFENLTAFVGKNDIGKSTVLEALDIFFNEGNGAVKMDENDINVTAKQAANNESVDIVIGVSFKQLPAEIVIDENNKTTLADEYLLDENNTLTILKKYTNAGKPKVYIYANHPEHRDCKDLLKLKQADLRRMTADLQCDHNKNAEMRAAIRQQHSTELNLRMQEIEVNKEDAKNIWENIKTYMPVYSLFQADRSNGDKDKEVQDPLKEAVKQIMSSEEIKGKCQEIYNSVMIKLQEVSDRTMQKIGEMNPNLANTLHPSMPQTTDLKWTDVFKSVSITGENDIPLNKRGSGVKRMVLLNFFRAETERTQQEVNAPGVIYAIEEPETSQHIEHQQMLIEALKNLSEGENCQIIITTHSSNILKKLKFENIRLISDSQAGKTISMVIPSQLPYPSLNEIAYTSFKEVSVEYHDELYSHIDFNGWLQEYKNGKTQYPYNRQRNDGSVFQINLTKTEIIRHQIHHPENHHNPPFSQDDLQQSIEEMRVFIQNKN